jgi:hypothetical protein
MESVRVLWQGDAKDELRVQDLYQGVMSVKNGEKEELGIQRLRP